MGYILLEGGAEFGGQMAEPDRKALALAGGLHEPVVIIPTAAAPDNNQVRAGNNGERWFTSLGATNVEVVPIIDKASANDATLANSLRHAKLIYLLGGFTHYLGQTLHGSQAWQGVRDAYERGAVIAGSSAGAMVLCEYYFNPGESKVERGLNLVPNACVLPHHNSFGQQWVSRLRQLLPNVTLLGIDERTGMIDADGPNRWSAWGASAITVYPKGIGDIHDATIYMNGERFSL